MVAQDVTRVILADGRRILREGLSSLLEKEADFVVVAQADHARAATKLLTAVEADVLVLLPGSTVGDLPAVIREIRSSGERRPAVVVGLGAEPDFAAVQQLISAGAEGLVARDSSSQELIEAIRQVASGKAYLSAHLSAVVAKRFMTPHRKSQRGPLAPREREILSLIADGHSTKQIAAALNIATKTVDTHRRRIMAKVCKRTLPELTKYALREGLTSLESGN